MSDETLVVPRELLESLVSEDECSFDHHGGCQTHYYLELEPGETCPQAQLRTILALVSHVSDRRGPEGLSERDTRHVASTWTEASAACYTATIAAAQRMLARACREAVAEWDGLAG